MRYSILPRWRKHAAVIAAAHVGMILWQIDARPRYDAATFHSFAGSFRHWFDQAAAAL